MEEILASIRRIIAEGEREAQEAGGQREPAQPAEAAVAARAEPAAEPNLSEASQTEVLVLTEMVQDDGSVVSLPPTTEHAENQSDLPATAAGDAPSSIPSFFTAIATAAAAEESTTEIWKPTTVDAAAAVEPDSMPAAAPASSGEPAASPMVPDVPPTTTPTPDEERIPVSAEGFKKPELVSEEALAASTAALSQLAHSVSRTREPTPGQSKTVEELVREAVEPLLKQWLDTNLPRIVERMVREAIDRVVRRVE